MQQLLCPYPCRERMLEVQNNKKKPYFERVKITQNILREHSERHGTAHSTAQHHDSPDVPRSVFGPCLYIRKREQLPTGDWCLIMRRISIADRPMPVEVTRAFWFAYQGGGLVISPLSSVSLISSSLSPFFFYYPHQALKGGYFLFLWGVLT